MPVKCSINELGIGRTLPLKLRFVIERPRHGQATVVRKLTDILCHRVQSRDERRGVEVERQPEKQNINARFSEGAGKAVRVKSKRVVSQKYPQVRQFRQREQNDKCFMEFFQFYSGDKQVVCDFKPYRQQEGQRGRVNRERSLRGSFNNRRPAEVRKKAAVQQAEKWQVEKWETEESMVSSFMLGRAGKD